MKQLSQTFKKCQVCFLTGAKNLHGKPSTSRNLEIRGLIKGDFIHLSGVFETRGITGICV